MREVTTANFGLLIAYLLPGFVALVGVGFVSETVASWLSASSSTAPTVGGFLYVTLASLDAGLTVSTIRWAVIDTIHHRTGIPEASPDFSMLQEKLTAYQYLVATHYHFYQFYSGMVCSVAFVFFAYTMTGDRVSPWIVSGFVLIELIFWLGSRDTLRKYYNQGELLLRENSEMVRSEKPISKLQKRLLKIRWPVHKLKSDDAAKCRSFRVPQSRRNVSSNSVADGPH